MLNKWKTYLFQHIANFQQVSDFVSLYEKFISELKR